jgi:hypothetical protein
LVRLDRLWWPTNGSAARFDMFSAIRVTRPTYATACPRRSRSQWVNLKEAVLVSKDLNLRYQVNRQTGETNKGTGGDGGYTRYQWNEHETDGKA